MLTAALLCRKGTGTANGHTYWAGILLIWASAAFDIIATVRPFDDPGPKLYYRLQRYQPSIVVKTHNVYEWSEQRLQRYIELFIKPNYSVTQLPGYDIETTANPFKVFEAIPPVARYQFLLDDARFFIEGFIKGPVCRGQIAHRI